MSKKWLGPCPEHDRMLYNDDYDAEFCPECFRWLAPKCSDPDCTFCSKRPETATGLKGTPAVYYDELTGEFVEANT